MIPEKAENGSEQLKNLAEEPGQLIAWGIWDKDGCKEENMGQKFQYPFSPKSGSDVPREQQRLAFKILKYVDKDTRVLNFWRHCRFDDATTDK